MSNYITYEERMEIENCLHNGKSFGQIAKELGKDRSTISREIRKHSVIERTGYGANGYCVIAVMTTVLNLKNRFV